MAPTDMGHPRLGQTCTSTHPHTHAHADTETLRVASDHSGRAKQKEHACLIHNPPFQHVPVPTHCDPLLPPPHTHTHTCENRKFKVEMNKAGRE